MQNTDYNRKNNQSNQSISINNNSQQQILSLEQILKKQQKLVGNNIWASAFTSNINNPTKNYNSKQQHKIISHQSIADHLQENSQDVKIEEDQNCNNNQNENQRISNHNQSPKNQKNQSDQQPMEQQQPNQKSQQGQINSVPSLNKKRTHRKSDISTFIMKAYKILEQKKNAPIVQWADQGNCFIVKDKQRFQNQILPKYFKHRKFSSFVRQLNMYDFHKIRKEKQIPIFRHKYFKQGGIDLLHKIKRKSGDQVKQDQGSLINHQETPRIEGQTQKAGSLIKSSITINNPQAQIDMLMRQNAQIQHSIAQIAKDINNLEICKDRKKQKLMKVISAMMFFDLKTKSMNIINLNPQQNDLRILQEHFVKDEEPWSFSQYSDQLSNIYSYIKGSILGIQ